MGSVIPMDVVEALMGYEGYLTEVYRRYDDKDLAKVYDEGEHAVMIFTGAEVGRLHVEIEDKNRQLKTLVNSLTTENLELKSELARMKVMASEWEDRLKRMEEATSERDLFSQNFAQFLEDHDKFEEFKPFLKNLVKDVKESS